jgi:hypothetical protein
MTSIFSRYKTGIRSLLEHLGKGHPRYTEALTLEARLKENEDKQLYGDTDTLSAERAQIVERLNELALVTIGVSFNALCDPDGRSRLTVIIVGSIDDFSEDRRRQVVTAMASALGVSAGELSVVAVKSGSVRVTLEVPNRGLSRLHDMPREKVAALTRAGVQKVIGTCIRTVNLPAVAMPERGGTHAPIAPTRIPIGQRSQVVVRAKPMGTLHGGRYGTTEVVVRNEGNEAVYNIRVQVSGEVLAASPASLAVLEPHTESVVTVRIRPRMMTRVARLQFRVEYSNESGKRLEPVTLREQVRFTPHPAHRRRDKDPKKPRWLR